MSGQPVPSQLDQVLPRFYVPKAGRIIRSNPVHAARDDPRPSPALIRSRGDTRQTIEDLWVESHDELTAMRVGPLPRIATLIWDARSAW